MDILLKENKLENLSVLQNYNSSSIHAACMLELAFSLGYYNLIGLIYILLNAAVVHEC